MVRYQHSRELRAVCDTVRYPRGPMRPRDTTPEVQRMLDEYHRDMSPAEKAEAVRRAWRTARAMQLAGLRVQHPNESEAQLEQRMAERWLGRELYRRATGRMPGGTS